MDISKLKDETENVSVSFRKSTIKRVQGYMKEHNIKKFSPVIDQMLNTWLNEQEVKKSK